MDTQKHEESRLPSEQALKLREVKSIETIGESLRSIAISFSTLVTMLEEDFKEEQAYRRVNERLRINSL